MAYAQTGAPGQPEDPSVGPVYAGPPPPPPPTGGRPRSNGLLIAALVIFGVMVLGGLLIVLLAGLGMGARLHPADESLQRRACRHGMRSGAVG